MILFGSPILLTLHLFILFLYICMLFACHLHALIMLICTYNFCPPKINYINYFPCCYWSSISFSTFSLWGSPFLMIVPQVLQEAINHNYTGQAIWIQQLLLCLHSRSHPSGLKPEENQTAAFYPSLVQGGGLSIEFCLICRSQGVQYFMGK